MGLGVLLLVVAGALGAFAVVDRDDAEPVRVVDQPPSSAYAAIAIMGDQIWVGGHGFVARGDGSDRIEVPGDVVALAAADVLWVRGRDWVVAVDVGARRVVGSWSGGEIGDIQPLPSQEVAISLPSTDEVVIAKTSAIAELEEVWRIPVRTQPHDLVRTTGGDVWVTCGDGISELDVGAQGVKKVVDWTGPLLAPSLDGGIWTTDGDRTIDLRPDDLAAGVSVAEGARYDVVATSAVETTFGLFVSSPGGLVRYSPQTEHGEVIVGDEPAAFDASGGQVAYILGDAVHTAMASGH